LQASPVVQALPSVQGVPGATCVWWQPAGSLQVSAVQGLLSSQESGVVRQVPLKHVSTPVQASPSLHDVPFGRRACRQPTSGSQESSVQRLWSSQSSS